MFYLLAMESFQDLKDAEHVIRQALKGLRYGSVEIVIHDSKIVQIDRKEKFRFNLNPHSVRLP